MRESTDSTRFAQFQANNHTPYSAGVYLIIWPNCEVLLAHGSHQYAPQSFANPPNTYLFLFGTL
jgi:hypothetical protein